MLHAEEQSTLRSEEGKLIVTSSETESLTRYAIIGSGPVGMRFAAELLKRQPNANILIVGNEPYAPYNRVQLSALLAGDVQRDSMDIPLPSEQQHPNFNYQIATIKKIDKDNQLIVDALGNEYPYDHLIFATGARAHTPNIPGVDQTGVYTFRNLKDTESLFVRVARSRHVVVVGGGLLGLEAARGMLRFNTKVTVVQQAEHLMNRQLDNKAAAILKQHVEELGIEVITQSGVREIYGHARVTGVRLYSGDKIDCDTVLLCAGITPNTELAKQAKIKVAKGIVVSDKLETSAANIYAIGECCEHQGKTYGLVAPGFEQAAVLADAITGGKAVYQGSLSISRLKVVGKNISSMGEVNDVIRAPLLREVHYRNKKKQQYRKLFTLKGKIIGAVSIGDWQQLSRTQESFKNSRYINPLQLLFFRLTGNLWFKDLASDITQWPATAIVCQCNSITRGELSSAIEKGCTSIAALKNETSAATVCGSCQPLLAELAGDNNTVPQREAFSSWILVSSILALLITVAILFMPEASVATSVQTNNWFEDIWSNKFWKQVTGFTLLGLSVIGLLMSLRKRAKWQWLGNFNYWRLLHIFLGIACISLLIFHTGFRLGENLNQALMINFISVIVLGASAGAAISLAHKVNPKLAKSMRSFWTWMHILVTWPLPALLGVHILSVYYF